MPVDTTRSVGVYRTSGGDEQVVASSGVQRFQSGGQAVFESGATISLTGQVVNTTGAVTGDSVTATRSFVPFVEVATSSIATLAGYGISVVTASTAVTLPLAAPSAGVEKWIRVSSTAATVTITSSSAGADIGGSTQIACSTGTKLAPTWVHLVGANSTSWTVLGISANVTIS